MVKGVVGVEAVEEEEPEDNERAEFIKAALAAYDSDKGKTREESTSRIEEIPEADFMKRVL